MKILYHHRIASKDGQYVHIEELTRALKRLGHDLVIVGPASVGDGAFGSESSSIALLKRFIPAFIYELLELGYNLVAYRRLAAAVKRSRPDGIYERYNLYTLAGIWIKRRYNLPLLLEVNAPLFEERSRYGGIALKWLARWTETYAWRNADRVLVVTQVLAERLQHAGVPRERIRVIPNGVDPDQFGEALDLHEAKKRLGLQNSLVVGFTGFVREWHGINRMVDLIAGDPTASRHLLVVGDGPARSAIEQRAAVLGVSSRVTVTGVVDRRQVVNYIAAFDIALQPDVVPYASPLKLFEYLALGRAVVAPDRENIREVLSHEHNALLFDAEDPDAFIGAVERLCADTTLREHIAENARRTIGERGYTWSNNAREVTALFHQSGVPSRETNALGKMTEVGEP